MSKATYSASEGASEGAARAAAAATCAPRKRSCPAAAPTAAGSEGRPAERCASVPSTRRRQPSKRGPLQRRSRRPHTPGGLPATRPRTTSIQHRICRLLCVHRGLGERRARTTPSACRSASPIHGWQASRNPWRAWPSFVAAGTGPAAPTRRACLALVDAGRWMPAGCNHAGSRGFRCCPARPCGQPGGQHAWVGARAAECSSRREHAPRPAAGLPRLCHQQPRRVQRAPRHPGQQLERPI
jgi:hypothetical protein